MIFNKQLQVSIGYDTALFQPKAMEHFAQSFNNALVALLDYCSQNTPTQSHDSTFSSANLSEDELADVLAEFGE